MKNEPPRKLLRRDLLKMTIVGVGVASAGELLPSPVSAKPVDLDQKRKARYRPDSQEVRNFYRVNGYPPAR
ncbi:formate dehydrogenase [Bradyrhizobium cosmicum]|uniref:formate dehydrogenase n=1 Tax=Bradyrhizobium cosmicum TaxID=1404864 RepID=UPI001181A596|nr:formate dehydrogenase [Bradyrhizobium cosmicum]